MRIRLPLLAVLGDLACDALKYISGADIALTNGGGIRTMVEIGEITYGEINSVFPFGNGVVTIEITGADLLAALEHGTKSAPAMVIPCLPNMIKRVNSELWTKPL